jgi:hypothetical protein
MPAHGRPGVADAKRHVAAGRLGDQTVGREQYLPGLGQDPHPGGGRAEGPAGAMQQPDTERPLEGHQVARDGRLRHPELYRRVGERARIHDRDQATQLPEFQVHEYSV